MLAFLSGGLLAFMLLANGTLAEATSPGFASKVAHATRTAVAFIILATAATRHRQNWVSDPPVWAFTGGLFGALIVAVTAIAMNSALGLVGRARGGYFFSPPEAG